MDKHRSENPPDPVVKSKVHSSSSSLPQGHPPAPPDLKAPGIQPLLQLIEILRGPQGCPWDQEQTLEQTRPNLIEEAHEVAAALDGGDPEELKEELGDLLFQVAFVAALADDADQFTFEQVVRATTEKMIHRHPHVFEPKGDPISSEEVKRRWQQNKRDSKESVSILDGIPGSMPELTAAYRMTEKAAGLGFDWPSVEPVFSKIEEEISELRAAISEESPPVEAGQPAKPVESIQDDPVEAELGDLLFTVVNLARHLGKDPARALARTNQKFRQRFAYVEQNMSNDSDLETLERLWQAAKKP